MTIGSEFTTTRVWENGDKNMKGIADDGRGRVGGVGGS